MSTTIRFVKPEHEEILRDYLADSGVSLIFGSDTQAHFEENDITDGDEIDDYDFVGKQTSMSNAYRLLSII